MFLIKLVSGKMAYRSHWILILLGQPFNVHFNHFFFQMNYFEIFILNKTLLISLNHVNTLELRRREFLSNLTLELRRREFLSNLINFLSMAIERPAYTYQLFKLKILCKHLPFSTNILFLLLSLNIFCPHLTLISSFLLFYFM